MTLVLSDFSHVEVFEQLPSSQELHGLGSERSAWGGGAERRTGRQVSELKGRSQHHIALNGKEISRRRCVKWPHRAGPTQHPGRVWVLHQDSMSPL